MFYVFGTAIYKKMTGVSIFFKFFLQNQFFGTVLEISLVQKNEI